MCGQNSADHILVEVDAKGLGQVLGDLRAAKSGITPLEFADGSEEFRCGPFWTWLFLRTRGVEESIFEILEPTVKAQQGGGLEDYGGAQETTRAQELRIEPEDYTVDGAKIWGTTARAAQDQELLFEHHVLSHEGFGGSGPEKFAQQVEDEEEDMPHCHRFRSVVLLGKSAGAPLEWLFYEFAIDTVRNVGHMPRRYELLTI